jgi:hypothetical protein
MPQLVPGVTPERVPGITPVLFSSDSTLSFLQMHASRVEKRTDLEESTCKRQDMFIRTMNDGLDLGTHSGKHVRKLYWTILTPQDGKPSTASVGVGSLTSS